MEKKEGVNQVLNDLLKINNDRIREYRKATKQIVDFEWRTIFLSMIDESKKFAAELTEVIMHHGGTPQVNSTTASGKIYRLWRELKDTLTGMDRESILNECEFVEEAAINAYTRALEHGDFGLEVESIIRKQYETLRSSQLTLNHYRDMSFFELYKA